jgi:hypothetical protein
MRMSTGEFELERETGIVESISSDPLIIRVRERARLLLSNRQIPSVEVCRSDQDCRLQPPASHGTHD